MNFNTDGHMQAGLHKMTLNEIEDAFVTPFPHSSTRKNVIDGYKKHTIELTQILDQYVQFIDGSYVTNKNDPGDIDLACFADGDVVDSLPMADKMKLRALMAGKLTKATHLCDAYFCPSYPETHPKFEFYRSKRKYWMGEFGYDRTDKPKGIVVLERTPPPPVAAPLSTSPVSAGS